MIWWHKNYVYIEMWIIFPSDNTTVTHTLYLYSGAIAIAQRNVKVVRDVLLFEIFRPFQLMIENDLL